MSNIAIKVENISKKYIIKHEKQSVHYETFSDTLIQSSKSIAKKIIHPFRNREIVGITEEEFWALKDINFEINQGDKVGIIGRNGAGKSTLLKVLSRITDPTTGKLHINGRIASLLEVGTGFHPELTGKENIYLNGAILGMSRREIKDKFDEIVAFAEVDKFLDTPVKRYSSGMYVRLAFSVAAYLEPEILVVDEVLAVGDMGFQKKCLGKMKDVSDQGRTVLFVSHNMAAIESLCSLAIVLEKGSKQFSGYTADAINFYLQSCMKMPEQNLDNRRKENNNGKIWIDRIDIENKLGYKDIPFSVGAELSFKIAYSAKEEIRNSQIIIGIYDSFNVGIARFDTEVSGDEFLIIPEKGCLTCTTSEFNLVPGRYHVNIAFFVNGNMEDYIANAKYFNIIESDYFSTGKIFGSKLVKVLIKHKWHLES